MRRRKNAHLLRLLALEHGPLLAPSPAGMAEGWVHVAQLHAAEACSQAGIGRHELWCARACSLRSAAGTCMRFSEMEDGREATSGWKEALAFGHAYMSCRTSTALRHVAHMLLHVLLQQGAEGHRAHAAAQPRRPAHTCNACPNGPHDDVGHQLVATHTHTPAGSSRDLYRSGVTG